MKCTECNEPIPFFDEDITVSVVYSDGRGIERNCHYSPFEESDPMIVAVLGSLDCLQKWTARDGQQVSTRG